MNPALFPSQEVKPADTVNAAGGKAYKREANEALAQYALTGTLGTTFYTSAKAHLGELQKILADPGVSPEFVARTAVYARKHGYMKDIPAYLVAWLAFAANEFLEPAFREVVDNGKMVKNVVQVCRSGVFGRRTIPRSLRRLINNWLTSAKEEKIIQAIPGQNPSLNDVVRMTHPKADARRAALLAYVIGKATPEQIAAVPLVQRLENFKAGFGSGTFVGLPEGIPFQLVDSLPLTAEHWAKLALSGGWHFVRMNLNTFARHGVFEQFPEVVPHIGGKLRDPQAVSRAKVFPYQLLAAYINAGGAVPQQIKSALADAVELAIDNVPVFGGKVYILVDTSGSMSYPVTGYHGGRQTSSVRCVDVASLFASTFLRKNPDTEVFPYDTEIHNAELDPRDTVFTNSKKLAGFGGGGTATGNALAYLNEQGKKGDAVIVVSDNESWADPFRSNTMVASEWSTFRKRNKGSKLVCIDITPTESRQAESRPDSLNVGGFSDNVWSVVKDFLNGELTPSKIVGKIEEVQLTL